MNWIHPHGPTTFHQHKAPTLPVFIVPRCQESRYAFGIALSAILGLNHVRVTETNRYLRLPLMRKRATAAWPTKGKLLGPVGVGG